MDEGRLPQEGHGVAHELMGRSIGDQSSGRWARVGARGLPVAVCIVSVPAKQEGSSMKTNVFVLDVDLGPRWNVGLHPLDIKPGSYFKPNTPG